MFCTGLGCSRCVWLVLYRLGLFSTCFAVLCGFMCFVLVSAALAAFWLVLYWLGLFTAGFAVLCGFMCFVLVSAALAAFWLVLYRLGHLDDHFPK